MSERRIHPRLATRYTVATKYPIPQSPESPALPKAAVAQIVGSGTSWYNWINMKSPAPSARPVSKSKKTYSAVSSALGSQVSENSEELAFEYLGLRSGAPTVYALAQSWLRSSRGVSLSHRFQRARCSNSGLRLWVVKFWALPEAITGFLQQTDRSSCDKSLTRWSRTRRVSTATNNIPVLAEI